MKAEVQQRGLWFETALARLLTMRINRLTPRSPKLRPDDLHHALGRRARRKEAEIVAVAIHQIDEGRMVDRVGAVLVEIDLCKIDLVRVGRLADRIHAAGQSDQARMKQLDVVGEMIGRV